MHLTSMIIKMVLPVIVMLGIGYMCNRKQLFGTEGLNALKNIIGKITLPVVLFNAFYTAEYNMRMLIVFVVVFISCVIALGAGFLLRRFVKPYGKFFPFLMSSFEAGMLGYSLFGLIAGVSALKTFAIVDIGQTISAYTVFLIALNVANGQKATPKSIVMNMVRSAPCMGMLFGVALGLLGVHNALAHTAVSGVITQLISFITAPTAGIILIIVGYEFSVKKELIKPVLLTVLFRFTVMAVLCTLASLIIFAFTPFDKELQIAMVLMFSLPAPFIIPLFADVDGHAEYISTSLSVCTLMTIIIFIGIAAFSMA